MKIGEILAKKLATESTSKQLQKYSLGDFLLHDDWAPLDQLLICETIADSIGHPCWDRPWNIYLSQWLYKSGFVASPQLASRAIASVSALRKSTKLPPLWLADLDDLLSRLRSEPRPRKRENPLLTKTAYKKIAIGFKRNSESFGVVQSSITAYNPTIPRAIEAAAIAPKKINSIWISFAGEPSVADRMATQILLHRSEIMSPVFDVTPRLVKAAASPKTHFHFGVRRTPTYRSSRACNTSNRPTYL